jgi:hypothetical protein
MMKTWLIRRAVRKPVLPEVTSRMSSSVCQAALHQQFASGFMDELDAPCRRIAVRHVNDLVSPDVEIMCTRRSVDLGRRPNEYGNNDPGLRRFGCPWSDVSSQGWTTTVFAAGTLCALAIRRSYLDPGG